MGFTALGFLSGSVAGATGLLVGYPLDTLKVRAQVGSKADGDAPSCRWERLRRLYRGSLWPTLTAGGIQCINFGVYENVVRQMSDGSGDHDAPLFSVMFAGVCGGLSISPFTCPQQRVKIHQQLMGGAMLERAKEFYRVRGIRGFYRGYALHAWMEACRGIYMATYVGVKRLLHPHAKSSADVPLHKRMLAGAAAGTVGWCVVYPADSIKSVLQAEIVGNTRFPTAWDCSRYLIREGGVARLYRGFTYTLMRAGPVAASLLPTYDLTLRFLTPYFSPSVL